MSVQVTTISVATTSVLSAPLPLLLLFNYHFLKYLLWESHCFTQSLLCTNFKPLNGPPKSPTKPIFTLVEILGLAKAMFVNHPSTSKQLTHTHLFLHGKILNHIFVRDVCSNLVLMK